MSAFQVLLLTWLLAAADGPIYGRQGEGCGRKLGIRRRSSSLPPKDNFATILEVVYRRDRGRN